MKFSSRAERIDPFYVMEVAKAAQAMAREVAGTSEPMIFLNIGEPDFTAPPLVQEAAAKAVRDGATQYTNALGLDALRERISGWYQSRFGVDVPARRIVVTAGASAALHLACLALIERGDEILMPDPFRRCRRRRDGLCHDQLDAFRGDRDQPAFRGSAPGHTAGGRPGESRQHLMSAPFIHVDQDRQQKVPTCRGDSGAFPSETLWSCRVGRGPGRGSEQPVMASSTRRWAEYSSCSSSSG